MYVGTYRIRLGLVRHDGLVRSLRRVSIVVAVSITRRTHQSTVVSRVRRHQGRFEPQTEQWFTVYLGKMTRL